jgi:superfamily II DNA or RNA helicase
MHVLRDYQLTGVNAVEAEFLKVRATLLEWATGLGKTVAASELIRRWHPQPCLFICHREELVDQAMRQITAHTGLECLREQGNHRIDPDFLFNQNLPVVASVQSLNAKWGDNARRMHKFKPALLIIDEVHHARSATYERVVNYCGANCKILGISATPKRHDKKALGKIFESVAHRYQIEEAVANGYLCDIAAEAIPVSGLDYSHLRIVAGDFDKKELARMMEVEETVQKMIHPSLEVIFGTPRNSLGAIEPAKWEEFLRSHGAPRKTLMFCASVGHAQLAADIFNRVFKERVADWVCGETRPDERKKKIDDFRSGSVPILCNMGIATEGFDEPSIHIVLHGRPTKSVGLYKQMLGRITRTLRGVIDGIDNPKQRLAAIAASDKKFARNIDFVGNSDRLSLVTAVDVLGGNYDDETKRKAINRSINKPVMIAVTLNNMEQEVQRERKARALEAERVAAESRKHMVAAAHFSSKSVNLFGRSTGAPWQQSNRGPSATEKQIKVMGRAGIHPDWWGRKRAGWIIGKLIENKWRLPADMAYLRQPKQKHAA